MSLVGFLAAIKAPLIVAGFVAAYTVCEFAGLAPTPAELSQALLVFFRQHGAVVIAPICFLENFAPVNSWFPAALAILTAMASTSGDPKAGVLMFVVIWGSSLLGLVASFTLGRKLGHRQPDLIGSPKRNSRMKEMIIALTVFVHPYTGSLHVFRRGLEQAQWWDVWGAIVVAQFLWSVFWALTIYNYGLWLYEGNMLFILIWGYIVVWAILDLRKAYLRAAAQ